MSTTLSLTNNSSAVVVISDPGSSKYLRVGPNGGSSSIELSSLEYLRLADTVAELAANSNYEVSLTSSPNAQDSLADLSKGDLAFWCANRITYGLVASNPSTASIVGVRRFNCSAGEAYANGVWYRLAAAATDSAPAGQYTLAGGAQGDLEVSTSYKAALVYAEVSGAVLPYVVFGAGNAVTGDALLPTDAEIATALGVAFVAGGPVHAFVRAANVTFVVAGGGTITQTTTPVREIFASY